jgi:enoyl-CoA hydratase/carnithine racemase
MTEHIKTSIDRRLACLTLDRPRALNALSLDMIRAITEALSSWRDDEAIDAVVIRSSMGRAFCAGGDIRYFHGLAHATPAGGSAALEDFFTEEYALNHLIHHYPKPYIALMDGVVMGGGMGISQGSRTQGLRVVTERTKMAMPEVNIGLFPDVGGSYFLPRARGRIGWYLALTGHIIGGADAVFAGLADALVPFEQHPVLLQELAQAGDAWRATVMGYSTTADSLEAIGNASLAQQEALHAMHKRSPTMLAVTLEQLERGAKLSLAECLRMERGMVRHCFLHGDVVEGIRAAAIDKDDAPRWNPATLGDVTAEMVEDYFAPVWPAAAHPLRHLD